MLKFSFNTQCTGGLKFYEAVTKAILAIADTPHFTVGQLKVLIP